MKYIFKHILLQKAVNGGTSQFVQQQLKHRHQDIEKVRMFVFCVFLCGSVWVCVLCVLCVLWLRLWLVDGGVGQKAETMLTGMTSDQDHPEHNVAYLQVIRVKTWCSPTSSMNDENL